jgi:hypothetical protein
MRRVQVFLQARFFKNQDRFSHNALFKIVTHRRHLPSARTSSPFIWSKIMKSVSLAAIAAVAFLGLGACGSSTGDRALSGGGIGAGVGAVGGLLVGAPVQGALIGGAVGAGAGALTDEDDIDLGKPIWK